MAIRPNKRATGLRWIVDVRNGRQQRTRRHVATHAQAKELEAALVQQVTRARLGLPPRRTLDEALHRWLATSARALKDHAGLRQNARAIRPFITGVQIMLAPDVADAIINRFTARGLAPATINRRLSVLRRICNLAFQWGWVDVPFGKRIKLLPEHNERHVYLTKAEVDALARAAGYPVCDAIRLAAYTGLRRSELLRATRAQYRDGVLYLDANTKSGKPRAVPVPEAVQAIAARLPLRVSPYALRRGWERARAALDLQHVHFHDLRHTFASLLSATGADIHVIGRLLGHANANTTRRYTHLTDAHLRAFVDRL